MTSMQPLKHPLDLAAVRVIRAEEHFADLLQRIVLHGQALTKEIEFNPHPTEAKSIVVERKRDLPPDPMFSILVGEVCYNLRAALDYLVFELAKHDSGAEQKQTQFLIEDDAGEFQRKVPWRLKGLTPAHVAAIEVLQPFKGCEWTRRLRDLSNPDKHRTLVRVQVEYDLTVHIVDERHLRDFEDLPGAIRTTTTRDGTQAYVKLRLGTALRLADDSDVLQSLEEILRQVAGKLEEFKSG
jgi:hypothetical protein